MGIKGAILSHRHSTTVSLRTYPFIENEQPTSTNGELRENPVLNLWYQLNLNANHLAGRPPFDVFNAESEDIESYIERLQEYFTAFDIKNDTDSPAKRRAILLTSTVSGAYRVLKDLSFPDAPSTKTFDQLVTLLRGHYTPIRL